MLDMGGICRIEARCCINQAAGVIGSNGHMEFGIISSVVVGIGSNGHMEFGIISSVVVGIGSSGHMEFG